MRRPSKRSRVKPRLALLPVDGLSRRQREYLVEHVRYCGSPYHKLNPADYGLPEVKPRPDKTLCDAGRALFLPEALGLLRAGIERGLVSAQFRGEWPQNIWSVDDEGVVYEAQLQNSGQGQYHGYPMLLDANFAACIREEWLLRAP